MATAARKEEMANKVYSELSKNFLRWKLEAMVKMTAADGI